jgi:hypothetical protein
MENKKRKKTETHHGRNSRNFPSRRKAFQYTAANSLEGSIIYVGSLYRKIGGKTSPNPESAYLPVLPHKTHNLQPLHVSRQPKVDQKNV